MELIGFKHMDCRITRAKKVAKCTGFSYRIFTPLLWKTTL